MAAPSPSPSTTPSRNYLDGGQPSWFIPEGVMEFIGFKLEVLSADLCQGRFVVNDNNRQPFGVLHGGVSCIVAESLASSGAVIASGFQRVAGIELKINHLKAAPVGVEILAAARPLHCGKNIHVWDVTLSKVESSTDSDATERKNGNLIAAARVTLMVGLGGSKDADGTEIRARI